MHNKIVKINRTKNIINRCVYCVLTILLLFSMFSCASIDPARVNFELKETPPAPKVTIFTDPLEDLGLMTEIYGVPSMKIMILPISDVIGVSKSTGGEVPQDITEMVVSTLNSIGNRIVIVPYNPAVWTHLENFGNFKGSVNADVVLTGAITEFDRNLSSRSKGTDVDAHFEISGVPDTFSGDEIGFGYGNSWKESLARITLDFNVLDAVSLEGISKINAVNTMSVTKGLKEKELGISIVGLSFGRKGINRKVQGRHDAVRMLVQYSMIEIVGKLRVLPYWKLLDHDAETDNTVLSGLRNLFNVFDESVKTLITQELLFLHGYDLAFTGVIDDVTERALQQVDAGYVPNSKRISFNTYKEIYLSIPINVTSLERRNQINGMQQKRKYAIEAKEREEVDIDVLPNSTDHIEQISNSTRNEVIVPVKGGKSGTIRLLPDDDQW